MVTNGIALRTYSHVTINMSDGYIVSHVYRRFSTLLYTNYMYQSSRR